MCRGCVETEYPGRGNTCLENGSFLLNYVGCVECNKRDFVLITNRATEEEDGEEIITYDHVCKNCHHMIARHEYTFSVVDDYQAVHEGLVYTYPGDSAAVNGSYANYAENLRVHHAVPAVRQGRGLHQHPARRPSPGGPLVLKQWLQHHRCFASSLPRLVAAWWRVRVIKHVPCILNASRPAVRHATPPQTQQQRGSGLCPLPRGIGEGALARLPGGMGDGERNVSRAAL